MEWIDNIVNAFTGDRNDTVVEERKLEQQVSAYHESVENRTYDFTPKVMSYPSEAGGVEMPHTVVFHINVRSNSSMGRQLFDQKQNDADWAASQQAYQDEYLSRESRAKGENEDTIMGAGAALAGGAVALGTNMGNNPSALAKPLLALGSGVAAGTIVGGITDTETTYRLDSSISLHINNPPTVTYKANWETAELGAVLGNLASGKSSIAGSMNAEMAELVGRGTIAAAASIPKGLGVDMDLGAAIEATSKKVPNPYKEQLFKSMDFRQFSFTYQFVPRNAQEYQNVQSIIYQFKRHMHPEVSTSGLFLIYPSEFNIEYYYRGSKNVHINKIASCVLTNMKITYGGDQFNTVKGTNGAPAEINLAMEFTELDVLNAQRIEEGM